MSNEQKTGDSTAVERDRKLFEALNEIPQDSLVVKMPIERFTFWVGLSLAIAVMSFLYMAWRFDLLQKAIPELVTEL